VDISIAVATPRGLVVPVLRNVESMGYSDIEKMLGELGVKVSLKKNIMDPPTSHFHCPISHHSTISFSYIFSQARDNKLAIEDMEGGTFTISNGGVFGSLFGTPIINPPQSAILGMHGIFDRPVAIDGKVRKGGE
jgi:2-oxoglutarate dehydrogenase E2 component (dihydrolipoamide succinyltransferase)